MGDNFTSNSKRTPNSPPRLELKMTLWLKIIFGKTLEVLILLILFKSQKKFNDHEQGFIIFPRTHAIKTYHVNGSPSHMIWYGKIYRSKLWFYSFKNQKIWELILAQSPLQSIHLYVLFSACLSKIHGFGILFIAKKRKHYIPSLIYKISSLINSY